MGAAAQPGERAHRQVGLDTPGAVLGAWPHGLPSEALSRGLGGCTSAWSRYSGLLGSLVYGAWLVGASGTVASSQLPWAACCACTMGQACSHCVSPVLLLEAGAKCSVSGGQLAGN